MRIEQQQVEAVAKNGKSIMVNGSWYSSFNKVTVSKGSRVSFNYKENDVDGRTYKNIVGRIEAVDTSDEPRTSGSSGNRSVSSANGGENKRSYGTFPVGPLDGQRCIIRQNAMAHATQLYTSFQSGSKSGFKNHENVMDHAAEVIQLARKIEGYTSGSTDLEMATQRADEILKTQRNIDTAATITD